jgi:predicted AAA+ superfamily ATPase
MIERPELLSRLRRNLRAYPVAVLSGPRQCGKTTLARQIAGSEGGRDAYDLDRGVTVVPLEQIRDRLRVPKQADPTRHGLH